MLGVLAQVKADKDMAEALVSPVEAADVVFNEIQVLQKEVDDLEYKLDYRGQGFKNSKEIDLEVVSLQSSK